MSLNIASNRAALSATHSLGRTNRSIGSTLGRISSGLRIASAQDDAAGSGVATNLKTEAISVRQAMRNTNDAISILETADAAASEISDMLIRTTELFMASASETLGQDERDYLVDEYVEIRAEIDRISSELEFNGISLNNTTLEAQVGVRKGSDYQISLVIGNMTTGGLFMPGDLRLADVDLAQQTLSGAFKSLDTSADTLNQIRSDIGAALNRLETSLNHNQTYSLALDQARSSIEDADMAAETSQLSKLQIMQQAGVASLAQAKNMNQSVIGLLS
jgi:flagellin